MFTPSRILGLGVAFGLAAGLLVGAGLNQPGRADAAAPSAAPTPAVDSGTADGAPAALSPVTTGGGTVTSAGSAIAYPYVGGSPGVAPDHTIVVTGVGQATSRVTAPARLLPRRAPSRPRWPMPRRRPTPSPRTPG